jgi:beta-glucuronidase
MWTEDYQVVTLREHFKAFDALYKEGFLIGEMIWNFADFATPQGKVNRCHV